jgi:hypothetical protein
LAFLAIAANLFRWWSKVYHANNQL